MSIRESTNMHGASPETRTLLQPFVELARAVDAATIEHVGVGLAGLIGTTTLPVGGEAIRAKCQISVAALTALLTPPARHVGRSALATDDDRLDAHAVIAQAVLGVGVADARYVADGIFDFDRAVECVADVLARRREALPVTAGDLHARDAQLLGGDAMWGGGL